MPLSHHSITVVYKWNVSTTVWLIKFEASAVSQCLAAEWLFMKSIHGTKCIIFIIQKSMYHLHIIRVNVRKVCINLKNNILCLNRNIVPLYPRRCLKSNTMDCIVQCRFGLPLVLTFHQASAPGQIIFFKHLCGDLKTEKWVMFLIEVAVDHNNTYRFSEPSLAGLETDWD